MKHGKRILSLLLALLLVTGCLSGLALTASATDYYSLYVGAIQVTSDNQDDVLGDGNGGTGSVSFDPDTRTLTLNNATLTGVNGSGVFIDDNFYEWNSQLTIELVGTNTIDGTAAGTSAFYGIRSSHRLNIRGSVFTL